MILQKRQAKNSQHPQQRAGVAAIEMALVFPVILLLVVGCLELGRTAQAQSLLRSAAQIGSQYGATHRYVDDTRAAWENEIRTAVTTELADQTDFDATAVSINIQTSVISGENSVAVQLTYTTQPLLTWPTLPETWVLTETVTTISYR